jgi:hypothetical protein
MALFIPPSPKRTPGPPPQATPEDAVRTLRVLVAALVLGMAIYVVVLLTLVPAPAPTPSKRLMALIVGPLWRVGLLASVAVPRVMARSARRAHQGAPFDEASLTSRWRAMEIARMAYLEGPGLTGAVLYQVTGEWWTLLAPALSVAVMLLSVPGEAAYTRFREELTGIRNY